MKGRLAPLSLVLLARAAWGDGWVHPTVEVAIDPCIDVRAGDVQRILGIELGASGEAPWPETVQVRASCAERLVRIEVDDPITRKSLARKIDLASAAGAARARLLALAIAELVAASWTELESNPDPRVVPAGADPSEEARNGALRRAQAMAPAPAVARIRILAEGGLRGFTTDLGVLWGGGGRLAMDFRYVGWWVELFADQGGVHTADYTVDCQTYSLTAGAFARLGWSRFSGHAGLGVRGGAIRMAGAWRDPMKPPGHEVWRPWVAALLEVGGTVAVTRVLALELAAEGGIVIQGFNGTLDGGTNPVASFTGPWVGATLGLGFFP
jgi:hypothetical protein